jgi:hypothetical protein
MDHIAFPVYHTILYYENPGQELDRYWPCIRKRVLLRSLRNNSRTD